MGIDGAGFGRCLPDFVLGPIGRCALGAGMAVLTVNTWSSLLFDRLGGKRRSVNIIGPFSFFLGFAVAVAAGVGVGFAVTFAVTSL